MLSKYIYSLLSLSYLYYYYSQEVEEAKKSLPQNFGTPTTMGNTQSYLLTNTILLASKRIWTSAQRVPADGKDQKSQSSSLNSLRHPTPGNESRQGQFSWAADTIERKIRKGVNELFEALGPKCRKCFHCKFFHICTVSLQVFFFFFFLNSIPVQNPI